MLSSDAIKAQNKELETLKLYSVFLVSKFFFFLVLPWEDDSCNTHEVVANINYDVCKVF